MSSAAKRRGAEFEKAVAGYLNDRSLFSPPTLRAPRWGSLDKGDLVNTGDFVFECKAQKSIDLAGFMDETEVERINAARRWGVCVVKRRNKPIAQAYVVQTLEQFVDREKERQR